MLEHTTSGSLESSGSCMHVLDPWRSMKLQHASIHEGPHCRASRALRLTVQRRNSERKMEPTRAAGLQSLPAEALEAPLASLKRG